MLQWGSSDPKHGTNHSQPSVVGLRPVTTTIPGSRPAPSFDNHLIPRLSLVSPPSRQHGSRHSDPALIRTLTAQPPPASKRDSLPRGDPTKTRHSAPTRQGLDTQAHHIPSPSVTEPHLSPIRDRPPLPIPSRTLADVRSLRPAWENSPLGRLPRPDAYRQDAALSPSLLLGDRVVDGQGGHHPTSSRPQNVDVHITAVRPTFFLAPSPACS